MIAGARLRVRGRAIDRSPRAAPIGSGRGKERAEFLLSPAVLKHLGRALEAQRLRDRIETHDREDLPAHFET